MERASTECVNEECWPLLGERRGRIWYARRWTKTTGAPVEVEFDAAAVIEREENRGDVVGFLHTHPATKAVPSRRDLDTMRAWVSSFGKPMLCVIDGTNGLVAWRFDDDESTGERPTAVEKFKRGVIIVVD